MRITKSSFKFIGEREATKDNIILDLAASGWDRGNKGCFFFFLSLMKLCFKLFFFFFLGWTYIFGSKKDKIVGFVPL